MGESWGVPGQFDTAKNLTQGQFDTRQSVLGSSWGQYLFFEQYAKVSY